MKKEKICCFITGTVMPFLKEEGENCEENVEKEKITKEIKDLTEKEGVNVFYTGMESGADLFAAGYVASLKENRDIKLHCVIPFEEQAADYSEEERDLYFCVAEKSDSEIMINKQRTFSCRKQRDIYMIKKSDIVFLFWDMKSPYASSLLPFAKDKNIIVIDPSFSKHNSTFRRIE